MMNFVHGSVGAVIVVKAVEFGVPFELALGLAFLSHFLLDVIPHWDPIWPWPPRWERVWPTLVDFLGLILILSLLFGWGWILNPVVFWGAAFGILPDVMLGISKILNQKTWVEMVHEKIQKWTKPKFWFGFGVQILVVLILVLILRWVEFF